MLKWLKTLRRIVRHYQNAAPELQARQIELLQDKYIALNERVIELTTVAADLGFNDDNYVVVIGRLRGSDYVRTFRLPKGPFHEIVGNLQAVEKAYGRAKFMDAPPGMRGAFRRWEA